MQFSKVDCVNQALIHKLKDHMTKSYKLGECQIVSKCIDISQSIKDIENLSIEETDLKNDQNIRSQFNSQD